MCKKKTYKVEAARMRELKAHGYEELDNCYFKDIGDYWYIRIDKKTSELKCWNLMNGKVKNPTPYIKDLIEAGIAK